MVVDFSRNPSKFAIAKYAQIVPVKQNVGYYLKMTVEQAGRIVNSDLADMYWGDGQDEPSFNDGTESFDFLSFTSKRYASGFRIGYLAGEQAGWDILAQHSRIHAQRMMTGRTQLAATALQTSGNYDATHTSAVSSIPGVIGKWDVSTTARKDIKRSLDYAADQIRMDTLGAVDISDLMLVISPDCARAMSVSQEIVDYIKGSTDALKEIRGEIGPLNGYGLPETLYGYKVVVEDAVKVTSRRGATKVSSYVFGRTSPVMVARPGSLEGVYGSPTFSTITLFVKEEMTVESKNDPDNRRTRGRIVDDEVPILTASVSGFLFTSAVA